MSFSNTLDAIIAKNQDAVVFGEEPGMGDFQDLMRKQTETTGREESRVCVCQCFLNIAITHGNNLTNLFKQNLNPISSTSCMIICVVCPPPHQHANTQKQ